MCQKMWQNERLQQQQQQQKRKKRSDYKCCIMITNTYDNNYNINLTTCISFWDVLNSVYNTRWKANHVHVIFSLKLNFETKSNVHMKLTIGWNMHCWQLMCATDNRNPRLFH
jgi:hypothetical protein